MSSGEEKKMEVFLTAKDIAERYGVSKQWPYHSPEMMKLRIKIGKYVRWRLSDLEALEAEKSDRGEALALFKKWELQRKRKLLKFDIA